MHTIGILLPGSTLYPSIGMDLLQGIKSCLKFNDFNEVDYQVNMVSYGLKDDEIQKLLVDIKDLLKEKVDHKRFMNGFSNNPN